MKVRARKFLIIVKDEYENLEKIINLDFRYAKIIFTPKKTILTYLYFDNARFLSSIENYFDNAKVGNFSIRHREIMDIINGYEIDDCYELGIEPQQGKKL